MMAPVIDETVNVLFIEGDPAVADLYQHKLTLDGYEVTIEQGDPGSWRSLGPASDLVFLDLSRNVDAVRALAALHVDRRLSPVPLIILSTRRVPELAGLGIKLRPTDYLVPVCSTPGLGDELSTWAASALVFE